MMRNARLGVVLGPVLAVTMGCAGAQSSTSAQSVAVASAATSSPLTVTSTVSADRSVVSSQAFGLLTHCGIHEAIIGSNYYQASPVLDDGNGNPPRGWANPFATGTMVVHDDGTAEFSDGAGNVAHFVLRVGASEPLQRCA